MDYVVTLIANPGKEPLSQGFVEGLAPSLALSGMEVTRQAWLAPQVAADVFVQADSLAALDAAVTAIMADQPFDAVAQGVENRRKKLLISDMDSTMITVECIDELADFVGKKAEVAAITERAMNGELVFESALRERVALLKGLPASVLAECYEDRVKMMAGAKALVSSMRAWGAHCVLVSGGFTFFTGRVREALGFHEDYSNSLEIEHGVLTGRVIPPILGKEAKLATLNAQVKALGISP
ncbi:MAG: phosphoserine phosphatase SerB, partial [Rickettsiales bacterium]|nr:phosphoserine phosphatase SerB [Rickettsiales bacterium]